MERIDRLLESAAVFYENDDPSHDFAHVKRVLANCQMLAATVNVNGELLLAAAILHDLVNLPKNHPERIEASRMAAVKSKEVLEKVGFRDDEIAGVSKIILEHSYSRGLSPSSVESAVLQDADKLDALGAIGIMRLVSTGTLMSSQYYDSDEPIAATRELDDKKFMIDHFAKKLFKLPELMNTDGGKAEALKRVEFMKSFLVQLGQEL